MKYLIELFYLLLPHTYTFHINLVSEHGQGRICIT